MSCGDPHETPCHQVLADVYTYLDAECDPVKLGVIQQHLTECPGCLREYGIEQEVKALVGRCCGAPAPEGLAGKLRLKLAALAQSGSAENAPLVVSDSE